MNLCVQKIGMGGTSCVQATAVFAIWAAENQQKQRKLLAEAIQLQQSYTLDQQGDAADMFLTKDGAQPIHQGPQRRWQWTQPRRQTREQPSQYTKKWRCSKGGKEKGARQQ